MKLQKNLDITHECNGLDEAKKKQKAWRSKWEGMYPKLMDGWAGT